MTYTIEDKAIFEQFSGMAKQEIRRDRMIEKMVSNVIMDNQRVAKFIKSSIESQIDYENGARTADTAISGHCYDSGVYF